MEKKRLIIMLLISILYFPILVFAETTILKSGKTVGEKAEQWDEKPLEVKSGPERYYLKNKTFSVEISKDWKILKATDEHIFIRSAKHNYVAFSAEAQKLEQWGGSAEGFFEANIGALQLMTEHKINRNVKVENIEIGGINAKMITYNEDNPYSSEPIKYLVYLVCLNNYGYEIRCFSGTSNFAYYKDKFAELIQSIKFE